MVNKIILSTFLHTFLDEKSWKRKAAGGPSSCNPRREDGWMMGRVEGEKENEAKSNLMEYVVLLALILACPLLCLLYTVGCKIKMKILMICNPSNPIKCYTLSTI